VRTSLHSLSPTIQYDALVGKLAPCAIPFLVSLNPCCSPCYKCADATGICCLATDPKRPSASAKPLVIFASRTVKDVAAYTTAFSKYGQDAMKGAGVRACFSFVDREKENTVLQLMWIDSADDFPTVPADVLACYAGSPETDYCQVWGGWDDALKAKMEVDSACKFTFCKGMKGYIKSPAGNEKGFNTGFQPMIWIAKKKIKPGQMEKCKKHFQAGTDMMYGVAPVRCAWARWCTLRLTMRDALQIAGDRREGHVPPPRTQAALGIAEYQPDDGSDFVWALRVFNDYNSGFKAPRLVHSVPWPLACPWP
jgi:hypothetical protein